jgi:transcriptional regulator with XRE-family HTH domain
MTRTVHDPMYRAALEEFSRELRILYRDAGDPPYRDVARAIGTSQATLCRVLNGAVLPRGHFILSLLKNLNRDRDGHLERLMVQRNAVRDILKPIGATQAEANTGEPVVWAATKFIAGRRSA